MSTMSAMMHAYLKQKADEDRKKEKKKRECMTIKNTTDNTTKNIG